MNVIGFFKYIDKLKRVKREGWRIEKIKNSESVAEHSFSTAILAMLLAPKLKVNREKFIRMSLIHDIGESIIGDVLWYDRKTGVKQAVLDKKNEDEMKAMRKILALLKGNKEYMGLWQEIAQMKTRDAKLLKEVDRLDLGIQTFFYEKRSGKNLQHFFDFVDLYIKHPLLKGIMEDVKRMRKISKK